MNQEKDGILAQLRSAPLPRPTRGQLVAAVGVAFLFAVVTAFGTAPSTLEIQGSQRIVVEDLGHPAPESTVQTAEGEFFSREERVDRGDTVAALLARLGITEPGVLSYLSTEPAAKPIFRQMNPGKTVVARVNGRGELQSLVFPLSGGKDRALVVDRVGEKFHAAEIAMVIEVQTVMKSAEIRYSLFGATDTAGIPDAIATQLADIFGGDVDFHRDLRRGDRFSVVYESLTYNGKPLRTGRILSAEFINNGRTYSAVWFEGAEGKGGYYTAEGKNIRKAFLRSPLEFSRITSGFSSARFHPVLQKWRAHKGTDYGAPVGTRVRATSDGVVEFAGVQGGYGKLIVLKHQGVTSTAYGHLSGFAAGVRKGSRVAQGDTIGYVGATGLASGPHLHYEFRINDKPQNSLTVALPAAPPLEPQHLARFRAQAAAQLSQLALLRNTNLALLD